MTRRKALYCTAGIMGMLCTRPPHAGEVRYDSITSATKIPNLESEIVPVNSKVQIILMSVHHQNTAKIASAVAGVLGAQIVAPQQVQIEALRNCNLIGWGSGIYDAKHHSSLLELADRLPQVTGKKAFIFSTSGMSRDFVLKGENEDIHATLKDTLKSKGYEIVGEFNCVGWNTNSFLKFFGGMNRGRPNRNDLKRAEVFAEGLRQSVNNS